jgi:nucleoside-diphosphate-sugar epimerase
MRVFVTGATGNIGSAVVCELLSAGHQVIGLSRSDTGAENLIKLGAEVQEGDLDDAEALKSGASAADGVIHLAFTNDFSDFAGALRKDLFAITAMGEALAGSGKPFVMTDHNNGEESIKAAFAIQGIRASVVSLAPTVHDSNGKLGFASMLIDIAREKAASAYVGDGLNRWPSVHRRDVASLFRLALEKAPAGSHLYGRGEEGIPLIEIAHAIGKKLNVPTKSIPHEEADEHFGFLGMLMTVDFPTMLPRSNTETKELLGWNPTHATLIDDILNGQ